MQRPFSRVDSPELAAWGILFFRYVCVQLALSPDALSQALHVDPRTFRRYQRHAVRRLTEQFVALEWDARREQRRIRLYAELPAPVAAATTISTCRCLPRPSGNPSAETRWRCNS